VTRILIVANRSIKGETLANAVTARLAEAGGQCRFHVLVPVAATVAPIVALGAAAADMAPTACFDVQSEREAAQQRLDAALAWCEERGVDATGELSVDADVATAAARLVEEQSFDEVIVSTLPTPVSKWLRQDLPRRIERKVAVPVTVVTPS
jgi:hypothetical protein